MVKKKRKSKRVTLKDKYKIQRRVVQTHRKVRKQTKRDAKAGIIIHNKKKKDPGIPNSWPFKNDLLKDIERSRLRLEEKKKNKNKKKEEEEGRLKKDDDDDDIMEEEEEEKPQQTLQGLMKQAMTDQSNYQPPVTTTNTSSSSTTQSKAQYKTLLNTLIQSSDILLQILDARDPLGTRIPSSLEHHITSHIDKKMIFILNKIDLVPQDAVSKWLYYLRKNAGPTVAMKSGTSQHQQKIGRVEATEALKSSCGVGVEGLMHLLKNYSRLDGGDGNNKKMKSCVTVGVMGYPNVGKSSLLNTLKRSRSACGVSSRAGFTTTLKEVVLDRNLRLMDSPGVVFDNNNDDNASVLRNCVNVESVKDPILAVEGLLKRCTMDSLVMTYGIPQFEEGNVMMFLAMVARKMGRVLKGGIPDKISAAKLVLRDWNVGTIPYYVSPPSSEEEEEEGGGVKDGAGYDAQIVTSFGEEFDVDKMKEFDAEVLQDLPKDDMDFVRLEPQVKDDADEQQEQQQDDDDNDMMEQEVEETQPKPIKKSKSKKKKTISKKELKASEVEGDEDMMEQEVEQPKPKKKSKSKKKKITSKKELEDADDYDFDDL